MGVIHDSSTQEIVEVSVAIEADLGIGKDP